MTCIVGLIHHGGVIVGADSAVTVGAERCIDRRKVRRRFGVLLGAAGNARECELTMTCRVPPFRRGDLRDWVSTRLAPAVLGACRAERGDGIIELELLIATPAVLMGVASDGASFEWPFAWGAVGGGSGYAMGSMHSTARLGWTPRRRVTAALEAAAAHCEGVGKPWTICETSR
jgi:ATP-dependent protease HslVU (ClpYQ) peptidase subunit